MQEYIGQDRSSAPSSSGILLLGIVLNVMYLITYASNFLFQEFKMKILIVIFTVFIAYALGYRQEGIEKDKSDVLLILPDPGYLHSSNSKSEAVSIGTFDLNLREARNKRSYEDVFRRFRIPDDNENMHSSRTPKDETQYRSYEDSYNSMFLESKPNGDFRYQVTSRFR